MATQQYIKPYSRSEQMKRELIGLVIGASLLMAGMAFIFSQSINADTPSVSPAVVPTPDDVSPSLSQPIVAPPPPPPAVHNPAPAMTLAALDAAADNTVVSPAAAPLEEVVAGVPDTQATDGAGTPVEDNAETPREEPKRTGWIYAGQFVDGKWSEKGLQVGAELPVSGRQYALAWGATVRDNPPGKSSGGGKLGKTVGNLASGKQVEVIQVKKSGSKGHIWLEVKM